MLLLQRSELQNFRSYFCHICFCYLDFCCVGGVLLFWVRISAVLSADHAKTQTIPSLCSRGRYSRHVKVLEVMMQKVDWLIIFPLFFFAASGFVVQSGATLPLSPEDPGWERPLCLFREAELLGDELPRGLAHVQLRPRTLAPVSQDLHLRPAHRPHPTQQCYHKCRGSVVQKDVRWGLTGGPDGAWPGVVVPTVQINTHD